MRNETVIQFTGSKVTHTPHPFIVSTLCGKTGGDKRKGDGHEPLPEVTCKNCLRTIPGGLWGKLTSPYVFLNDAYTSDMEESQYAEELMQSKDDSATWYPSRDGETSGILAIWSNHFKSWIIAHN